MKLLFLFTFFSFITYADEPLFLGFGLGPARDMDIILSASPPLPMIEVSKGVAKLSIKPTYFIGKNEFILFENKFKGGALAFNYSYVVTKKWGWYISGQYMNYRGDHRTNILFSEIFIRNINANFFNLSGGIHYNISKQKSFLPSSSIIIGPLIKYVAIKQTYKRVGGFNSDSSIHTNTVLDFDMEANHILPSFLLGGQLNWNINKSVGINPFGFIQIPLTTSCKSYKVTNVRTDLEDTSSNAKCRNTNKTGLDFSTLNVSGGINITYIPWDISFNVTAPFIQFTVESYSEQTSTIISFSKSFDFK